LGWPKGGLRKAMENPDTEWTLTERRTGLPGADTDPGAVDPTAAAQPVVDPVTGTMIPRRRLSMARWRRRYGDATGAAPAVPAAQTGPGAVTTTTAVRRVPNYNYRAIRVIRYVTGVLEIVLLIRFFLRLLGASPEAAFSVLIYGLTEPFVLAFEGLFQHPGRGTVQFDSATAVAMVIYPLLAWAITSYIRIKTTRKPPLDGAP
jgi:YGGT family